MTHPYIDMKDFVKMLIDITEVATGETVTVEWEGPEDGAEFWWEDGNGGCDCNRELYFRRAQGIETDAEFCSHGRFTVANLRRAESLH